MGQRLVLTNDVPIGLLEANEDVEHLYLSVETCAKLLELKADRTHHLKAHLVTTSSSLYKSSLFNPSSGSLNGPR